MSFYLIHLYVHIFSSHSFSFYESFPPYRNLLSLIPSSVLFSLSLSFCAVLAISPSLQFSKDSITFYWLEICQIPHCLLLIHSCHCLSARQSRAHCDLQFCGWRRSLLLQHLRFATWSVSMARPLDGALALALALNPTQICWQLLVVFGYFVAKNNSWARKWAKRTKYRERASEAKVLPCDI